MGRTVWRRRHGDWEPVMANLSIHDAELRARVGNNEATAEHTGWSYCTTADGVRPDANRRA